MWQIKVNDMRFSTSFNDMNRLWKLRMLIKPHRNFVLGIYPVLFITRMFESLLWCSRSLLIASRFKTFEDLVGSMLSYQQLSQRNNYRNIKVSLMITESSNNLTLIRRRSYWFFVSARKMGRKIVIRTGIWCNSHS